MLRFSQPRENPSSHIGVIRAAAALGHGPGDISAGVLNIAGFTVDAVLSVDLKAFFARSLKFHHLVHARRAIALRRFGPFGQVNGNGNRWVCELQVGRLIFFVIGRGDKHGR